MNNAQPLNDAHGKIDSGAHVVRRESAHKGIEFCGCRTDAKKERDFDEDDEEGARAGQVLVREKGCGRADLQA